MMLAICLQVDGHYSGNYKSPMEYIHDAPPIKVHGSIVASFGCAPVSPSPDLPQILYLNVLRSLVVFCTTERFGLKNCKGLICCLLIAADDPALGAPVEYIDLRGTSYDNPMVCKYTGQGARISDPVSCAWHKHWKYDTMTHIINCSQCVAHIRQQLMCAWPCR